MDTINSIVKRLRENRILQEKTDYGNYSREDLIKLAQGGDQLAISTLIQNHSDFISKMSHKYVLDASDREDVEQVATYAFWTAVQDWDGRGNFEAYAGRRIKNRLEDELRKESAGKTRIHIDSDRMEQTIKSDGEGGEQTLGDTIPADMDSPEDVAAANELLAIVAKFLEEEFTEQDREILQMSIDGYKPKEIAEVMGLAHKKVDNVLYKIRYHLKNYLRNNESKRIRREKAIEFSDEEKKILEAALNQINEKSVEFSEEEKKLLGGALKSIRQRESQSADLEEDKSYEDYSEEELSNALKSIAEKTQEIIDSFSGIHYEDRDDLLQELRDLKDILWEMDDYLTPEQQDYKDDILYQIRHADETEYDGPSRPTYDDPYRSRGLKQSDFM